mgnify:CR=1 FL=1
MFKRSMFLITRGDFPRIVIINILSVIKSFYVTSIVT